MMYEYMTQGTCSKVIRFSTNEKGELEDVQFVGGCNGNLKGIASLVKGMKVEEVIKRLDGITCGMKGTSCPDQLARALKEI
ncbi:MAG: TIGR03905 family TSCPD domain-containing protein [Prevotella sp.]|nr:TIGR03905 family TSCPD domain-containing protein [Prevotella sp.]